MRIVFALLILTTSLLAGCGNKGPLYLPQQSSAQTSQ
ncbi:LPS translocon maturation chaperone LptM [Pokkaliibacter plantistimulans]|uniref:Lipopeptide n=2 Tax=Pseudomonadota TaxID=1224 RepID=A0A2S5KV17_9PROT|nr:lipoprotein [Pokkaliibacter plantistimulans]PPC78349.1 hypothetical protein C4K68_05810 [Pokkaliibacter plantistimulans]